LGRRCEADLVYDSLGNLRTKDDATTRYSYPVSGAGSVRPHALGGIESPRLVAGKSNPAFSYDSNGNLEEGLDRRYVWTSFNQAATIDRLQGGLAIQRTAFTFDTEQQRVRQSVHAMNGGSPQAAGRVIHYAGSIEKEVDVAANVTTIRIPLGEGLGYLEERFASTTVDAAASGPRSLHYLLGDHLGSAVAVLDQNRVVLQRMSYDPWGRRRNTDGSDDIDTSLGTLSNLHNHAGYTGQEQLDHLALVHLNGRIYDPITSRMISADPTVPDPSDTQHLNRYTYVSNNALTFVDPSGFAGLTAMGRGDWQVVYNSKADGPAFDRSGGTNGLKLTMASTSSPTDKPLSDAEMMEKAKQLEIERKAREAAQKAGVSFLQRARESLISERAQTPLGLEPSGGWETPEERVETDVNEWRSQQVAAGKMHPMLAAMLAMGVVEVLGTRNPGHEGTIAAAKSNSGAESLANAARLKAQLVGQEIAGGHAFEKHVIMQGEFRGLGIRTRDQFASHIESVVANPTASRQLNGGRTAYWDEASRTVVIRNPKAADGGTAFQPVGGRAYYDNLK